MNTQLQAPAFDVAGPLPRGVTVLEASAGTGKTYAIAALAARYVADGTPLERVLLVTFTRMATGELRERVRERLLSVLHGLDQVLAGVLFVGDHVVELLAEGPEELVLRRRDRLARALANFDAATIATTHGFCQEVLGGLGIAADLEPNVEFVEDLSDLLSEVVDDLYVRRFHGGDEPPFTRAEALKIARIAVENPDAAIAVATGDVPQMRRRLALAVRQELEARKQRLAVMTYDDLLTRLDAALGSSQGAAIAARLRARYDVVLVDEFQDTDPMQWNIMRRAFAEGERALVLIADPKQAIYAFRGADVYAYLDAARAAVTRATLTINWRSDQGLIDAYDALFANSKLGDEGIVYRRVQAADANCARRLHGAPHGAPLRIRVVERESVDQTARGFAQVSSTREHIARDLAGDAVTLLSVRRGGRDPLRGRHDVTTRADSPGAHRRAGADQRDGGADPPSARGRGDPGGHQRRRQRVRHRHRAGMAASARGARAADLDHARALRGAHRLSRMDARTGCVGRRDRNGSRSTSACTTGRRCCASTASPRCFRRSRASKAWLRACSRRPTASGG